MKFFYTWKDHPSVFLSFFMLLCFQTNLFAQSAVTGTVRSSDGEQLPGATVVVKGTQRSTSTNVDGKFSIQASPGDTLAVSYIGYTNGQVAVTGAASYTITLQRSDIGMNEVVVIGYQTVRKKDLTGAIATVNTKNSASVTATSVGESLQGLVPGLTVRNGGAPGQNPVIEIRGVASFTNSDPLYVIDGMIADANATINTNDIESIQVLKDASAAAIYGSRAANGVIILTTKRGKSGPARISISAKYGIQQLPKRWDVMDAGQYLQTAKTQYANSGQTLPPGIAAQLANNTINTDWQDAIYRTGNSQDYNIGISGGGTSGNYLISGSYFKNKGVLVANEFQRGALRINTEAKKGRLTVGENMVLSYSSGNNPLGGINAFYEAPQMLPIIAVQSNDYKSIPNNPGGWGIGTTEIPTYANNYLAVAALDKGNYNYSKIVGNAYVDFKIADWLSYRANAGLEASFDNRKEVRDTGIWRYANQPAATFVTEERSTYINYLLEHTLNFNKTFDAHNINGVVGYSYQQFKRDFTNGSRTGLQNVGGQTYTAITSALGIPSAGSGTDQFYRIQGFLGRLNYTYNDKYLLTLSGRIDQDSRFGPDYRTGKFYAAALSWRLSKEPFFHVDWISDLKLRASYGQLGISNVLQVLGGSWPTIGFINRSPRAVYGVDQTPIGGAYQAILANPDLRWEKRDETNVGVDASLFNDRIIVTLEGYNNKSKDVLVDVPLGYYLGTADSKIISNAASIRNRGIEFSVTYRHNKGPFLWDIGVNGTTIQNRVIGVGNQGVGVDYIDAPGVSFIRSQIGRPMSSWFMLKSEGIFQSQDEINNYKNKSGQVIQPQAKPGDIKYLDDNGDGQITNDDRVFVGSPWPTFQGGMQFNASYKQFSLNLQVVGVFGYKVYNDIRRVLDGYQTTNFRKDINPWTPTNTNTDDPRLGIETDDAGISFNNNANSSRWLENASYVRIRNVELGYSLPAAMLKKAGFATARVFVSGQNLLTFTGYKGLDPDVTGAADPNLPGSGVQRRGFDNGNWPAGRLISFGVQCEF